MDFDPHEAARISVALLQAIARAKALSDAGDTGPEIADIVRDARVLYDLMGEQLFAADPTGLAYVREEFSAMGDKLVRLEWLISDDGASQLTNGSPRE